MKDTRTAWAKEWQAKRDAWDENARLRKRIAELETLAGMDTLGKSLAKRDLEQQAKGIEDAMENLFTNSYINTVGYDFGFDIAEKLREQAKGGDV